MLRDRLQINRARLEFYYSIFILVVIPLLITANTLLLVIHVRRNFDAELRRKADLANTVLGAAVREKLDAPEEVQEIVRAVMESKPELERVIVARPSADAGEFLIIAANDAGLIGQNSRDLQFTVAASRNQAVAQLLKGPESGRYWSVTSPLKGDDGRVVGLLATDVSLENADALIDDTLLRSLGILVVTVLVVILLLLNHFRFVEYAMLFKRMKELDQLKNDFLSVATHELKAPMTVVKGNIENILDGVTGKVDDRARQSLEAIFAETERLNSLVNDLLNVSRLEQGRVSYDIQVVDAAAIIDKLVEQFTPKAKEKGLELRFENAAGRLPIAVDPGRLTEIMTNLIDNAIKYSDRGTVTVGAASADGRLRITVRDTGIGMTAAERDKLFTRFYRVRNDKTKDITGTGLGLWIVKQYVEHMKGAISVDSLEGVGTEFTIEFPLAKMRTDASGSPSA